jgi:hypothetical protein
LASFGFFWLLLASFGFIWLLLASFGFIWLLLASFGFFWLQGSFGFFWLHLASQNRFSQKKSRNSKVTRGAMAEKSSDRSDILMTFANDALRAEAVQTASSCLRIYNATKLLKRTTGEDEFLTSMHSLWGLDLEPLAFKQQVEQLMSKRRRASAASSASRNKAKQQDEEEEEANEDHE